MAQCYKKNAMQSAGNASVLLDIFAWPDTFFSLLAMSLSEKTFPLLEEVEMHCHNQRGCMGPGGTGM